MVLNKDKFEKVRNIKFNFLKKTKLSDTPVSAIDLIKNTVKK